eukprot:gnl/TRDRNA2_/TRDRNA2_166056_c1_seq1.p1 gnl/TRDRNA2_/TRDRNA2_166056_c1~~gnl/TRDRNA2_/TRDRNA2_166056_c1_seq1.p1  ORF type:complete len:415 (+),score=82.35 gnl/TRDRNA2_/TRDRNA2_166056_c1_seq1:99-1343(+)
MRVLSRCGRLGPSVDCRRVRWQSRQFAAHAAEEGPLVRLNSLGAGVAELMLCRPKKLNSLSLPMIGELKEKYSGLSKAGVRCVVLQGEGRALCAGGDVAEVRDGVLQKTSYPADFFYEEYQLDYQIAMLHEREKILQVALWDGIVMGGGVGLSVHSPIRIATEKTMFAMPETAIGLFPDVGGTWALSRLKAGMHVGLYLGLTGDRLGAADSLEAGLATHYCPSDKLDTVKANICALGDKANDLDAVSDAIHSAADGAEPDMEKAFLAKQMEAVERCFGGVEKCEDSITLLEKEVTFDEKCSHIIRYTEDWAARTLKTMRTRSPTSMKMTLEAIKRHSSPSVDLRQAFITEYRMAQWCMREQPHSDFCEGIRAVLVDKDNKPKWIPRSLEEVRKEKVDEFFAPLGPDHPRGELKI